MRRSFRAWWREGERWYLAVGLANLVLGTSSVLTPLMLSEVLGHSAGALGVLSGLVSLVGVAGSLMWGRLSDAAHRRKPFVVASYAAVAACFVAIAFAPSFGRLLLLNMLLNFFWVANASVTVLIVIENQDQGFWERKISRLNQLGAIGWVLGLAIGGGAIASGMRVLNEAAAIRMLFIGIGIGAGVAAFLAFRWIPRTIPRFTRRRYRGVALAVGNFLVERVRYGPFHLYHRVRPRLLLTKLLRPEGFLPGTKRFLAATMVAYMALGLFGIPLPLLLAARFEMPSALVFLYFTIQHLGVVVAYPIAARRIKRRGNRRVQFGSLLVRCVLFAVASAYLAGTTQAPSTWALIVGFALYGLTWSFFQLSGIVLTSRLAKAENRGLALGLYTALAGIGWIFAGFLSGALVEHWGYHAAFAASAGLIMMSLVILRFVPDPVSVPIDG